MLMVAWERSQPLKRDERFGGVGFEAGVNAALSLVSKGLNREATRSLLSSTECSFVSEAVVTVAHATRRLRVGLRRVVVVHRVIF